MNRKVMSSLSPLISGAATLMTTSNRMNIIWKQSTICVLLDEDIFVFAN